jgi:ribose-phosphate pyrophosphokinase
LLGLLLKKQIAIISGPSSLAKSSNVAKAMNAEIVPTDLKIYSDGENRIRITKHIEGKNCVIIQSTYPPTDRHLLQALMLIKNCVDDRAANIIVVIPYMAYARQDKAFLEGEVVSMDLVAKLLEVCGTKQFITVDIHSRLALSYFTISAFDLSSIPLLANYSANMLKLDNNDLPLIVSPDYGGIRRAQDFSRILKTDMIALKKTRDRRTGQIFIDEKEMDPKLVKNRDAIIVDDIISTGGTIAEACKTLKKNGSGKVYAMCTHALLIGDSANKIKAAGIEEIIATNSVSNNEFAKVDVSPVICEALGTLIEDASSS